ncbi:hypothetical protein [Cellvibrio sp. PSBB023]|uniref:hypothetical protein n=1 Tax=Cellvibrio sp. PSBB023 TaxID=1945512 RepID=UPI000990258A|nr:hypothetical protein [Cellvibrio sp. PSBB023]AQT59138.1 hypothetical protein B0D95_02840 [Cellvibrio sp. PSBB023]
MLLATYKIIHVINNLVTGYRSYGVRLFLGGLAILASTETYAVVPTDNNFDSPASAPYEFTSPETIDGARFTLVAPAGAKSTITANDVSFSITPIDGSKPYGFDLALIFNIDNSNTVVGEPLTRESLRQMAQSFVLCQWKLIQELAWELAQT